MKKFGEFVCKHKKNVIIISCILLLLLSMIGMYLTKVNYDILVYLPDDIDTIKGQDVLVNDFNMGAYSITIVDNMSSKDILKLESDIKNVSGVANVMSLYDAIGTGVPVDMLPNEIVDRLHKDNSDLLFITFNESTSNEKTLDAVREIRKITDERVRQGGMSSMVLDTMNLSEKEIAIYICIAVVLCILVLELSLDSYVAPILLLANIGCAIVFNLGTNIFLGQISYITKALVAALQLGVTTDFSIFLYHSYEKKKNTYSNKEDAMVDAIKETFVSVTGSSLTTIVGFLALCSMKLTLGIDLGIVMAKGVLLGVVTVLTLFPSLLLVFDKLVEKTKHKVVVPNFNKLNKFIIKHHIAIFACFIILFVPVYLANSKVDVYYKLDSSLPKTLESVSTNERLKEDYNIVSPEIILVSSKLKNDDVVNMIDEIKNVDGIDFVLSFASLKDLGITENMLDSDTTKIFENEKYQMLLVNSTYDIATDELNNQTNIVNKIVKKYDKNAIVAGEGPLMKDLVEISDTDFNNVNTFSIACIFLVLFFVLRSLSLPFLLIVAIEFAIFMNMSISYFSGVSLPFIAPIVLGTIQLGATIDYAILMTVTYLDKRRNGIEKNEAMLQTLNYCGNSILVSGMCFFAATFGVGLYSEIEMIGSLCTLISRGAVISMIVVVTVLPAILLIFDKLILKTTLKNKEEKKMKNKKIVKTIAFSLVLCVIAVNPLSTYALTKSETVYSKLNTDGSVKSIVVNEKLINNNELEVVEDYSELKDILNISNDSTYDYNNNKLTWKANGKDVLYQGTTDKNLPITTKVSYKLDGKEMGINDILGKSGKVTITISYKNNDKHGSLYTPFVVTMGTVIDSKNNSNITITNGKSVSNGTKNVIVGLALPGLYESLNLDELKGMDTITLSFDTKSFELPSIYSVITPKLIDTSDFDVFSRLDSIYSNVDKLQENMNLIDKGAKDIASGSDLLKNTLASSINDLSKNESDALNEEQLNGIKDSAINSINEKYTDTYKNQIANASWEQVKSNLANSNDKTVTNYVVNSVTNATIQYLKSVGEYDAYVSCNTTGDEDSCNIINNDQTLVLIQQILKSATSEVATNTTNYIAEVVAKSVAPQVSYNTALEVSAGVSTEVAKNVANQVKNTSVNTITDSLNNLYDNINKLDDGIQKLSQNLTKFNNEGISKISSLVDYNVKGLTNKVQELNRLSNEYSSFAGKSSEGETKFVLVIDSIKAKSNTDIVKKTEDKVTVWDRVKNLFK